MRKFALGLLILLFCWQVQAEPYRLVVMPDVQFASQKWPHLITAMSQWLLKNQTPLNIK
jgi:hypothetical protein